MIDLHFLEFAMGNKLSPEQVKEVLSAMRLKTLVEKKIKDEINDPVSAELQSLLDDSEKDL